MSETIKWSELAPMERNALVAEKVFGRKIYRVDTWGQWLLYHETKPGITEAIPRYSELMDAAWLVLKRVAQLETVDKEDLTYALFGTTWGDLSTFQALDILCAWTPESICLAALAAVGIELL